MKRFILIIAYLLLSVQSKADYLSGQPYDSTQNTDPIVAALISVIFIALSIYIELQVRKSLKKDKDQ